MYYRPVIMQAIKSYTLSIQISVLCHQFSSDRKDAESCNIVRT